jgi:hypothetical protein
MPLMPASYYLFLPSKTTPNLKPAHLNDFTANATLKR